MKTLSIPSSHHTAFVVVVLALILWAVSTLAPPLNPGILSFAPVLSSSMPAGTEAAPAKTLPFTMDDVVAFLSRNFEIEAVSLGSDYAEFIYTVPQADFSALEIMRISVRARSEQVQVAFTFREFNAMHYVAEFIEGRLFTRSESEKLYGLLSAPDSRRTWHKVGRFDARAALIEVPEATEARFEFAPMSHRR